MYFGLAACADLFPLPFLPKAERPLEQGRGGGLRPSGTAPPVIGWEAWPRMEDAKPGFSGVSHRPAEGWHGHRQRPHPPAKPGHLRAHLRPRFTVERHLFYTGRKLLRETEMSQDTAASYARISPNDPHSLMAQLETIRRFAEQHGLEVAREFEDEGHRGATDNRSGFQKMIAAALSPEKLFDSIIVYDLSRFSGNASDLTRYRNHLEEVGVRVLSATGSDSS